MKEESRASRQFWEVAHCYRLAALQD